MYSIGSKLIEDLFQLDVEIIASNIAQRISKVFSSTPFYTTDIHYRAYCESQAVSTKRNSNFCSNKKAVAMLALGLIDLSKAEDFYFKTFNMTGADVMLDTISVGNDIYVSGFIETNPSDRDLYVSKLGEWSYALDGAGSMQGNTIKSGDNGNLFVGGIDWSLGSSPRDMLISKWDNEGLKNFVTIGTERSEEMKSFEITQSALFYSGHSTGFSTFDAASVGSLSLDLNTTFWSYAYISSGDSVFWENVISNGFLYLAGSDEISSVSNCCVMKVNQTTGAYIWGYGFGPGECKSIALLNDGVALLGTSGGDYFLVKFFGNGTIDYSETYGSQEDEEVSHKSALHVDSEKMTMFGSTKGFGSGLHWKPLVIERYHNGTVSGWILDVGSEMLGNTIRKTAQKTTLLSGRVTDFLNPGYAMFLAHTPPSGPIPGCNLTTMVDVNMTDVTPQVYSLNASYYQPVQFDLQHWNVTPVAINPHVRTVFASQGSISETFQADTSSSSHTSHSIASSSSSHFSSQSSKPSSSVPLSTRNSYSSQFISSSSIPQFSSSVVGPTDELMGIEILEFGQEYAILHPDFGNLGSFQYDSEENVVIVSWNDLASLEEGTTIDLFTYSSMQEPPDLILEGASSSCQTAVLNTDETTTSGRSTYTLVVQNNGCESLTAPTLADAALAYSILT